MIGKFIVKSMEEPLKNFDFKETDKIMVIGKPSKQDQGLALLLAYEKSYQTKLNESFKAIGDDITELEKNFLEGMSLFYKHLDLKWGGALTEIRF